MPAPCGGIAIVTNEDTITQVAQRLMCWSNHDKRIKYLHANDLGSYFYVPQSLAAENYGPLLLKTGGTAVPFPTTPLPTFTTVGVDDVEGINPNSCVEDQAAPTALAAAAIPETEATNDVRLTWTHDTIYEHREQFTIFFRVQPAEGEDFCSDRLRWNRVNVPGYARRLDLRGLEAGATYEFKIRLTEASAYYPVYSLVSAPITYAVPAPGPAPEPEPEPEPAPVAPATLAASSGNGKKTATAPVK